MPQSTRLDKYRKYREQITRLPDSDAVPSADPRLLSPQKDNHELKDDGIVRTTSIPVSEIIKATSEISGIPDQDDDFNEVRQNRRFIIKVALICFAVVIAIILITIWIINGGFNNAY